MMISKWFPDFRLIIPMILGMMTITTAFPLPHQIDAVQKTQAKQEQAK